MPESALEVTEVPDTLDGVRVDKAVSLLADLPRSSVDRLVAAGRVIVDGEPVTSRRQLLRAGQRLMVGLDERSGASGVPEAQGDVAFTVVFEDADVVVVDKPAGLVVHPGAGHTGGTLVHGLLSRYPDLADLPTATATDPERPGIVHRLDRGTSGLLVVARTPEAHRSLIDQLSRHEVRRQYRALADGSMASDRGVVDAPVGRSASSPTRMAVTQRGRQARTHYAVVARYHAPVDVTLLDVDLETGRTHQIRVHLAAIGHPVVADPVYGRRGGPAWAGSTLGRPFLHAAALSFVHPVTGQPLAFSAPLPDDLVAVLGQLRGLEPAGPDEPKERGSDPGDGTGERGPGPSGT